MAPRLIAQLIHISDVHFANPGQPIAMQRWLPWQVHGLMGHDAAALRAFDRSVVPLVADPNVRDVTWLLATGDLSTTGELVATQSCLRWCTSVAARHGIRAAALYGNHDVWPGDFPLKKRSDLDAHRTSFRQSSFQTTWPMSPVLEHQAPGGGAAPPRGLEFPLRGGRTLTIGSLNTIRHEKRYNVTALGKVEADRYWESPLGKDQLAELSALAGRRGGREFRVVLSHHPVHFPNAQGSLGMVLHNASDVARDLAATSVSDPLGSMVISGHTHETFPAWGQLGGALPSGSACQVPLKSGQVQLIVGTLSQRPPAKGPPGHHEWQLLSFWEDDSDVLHLERAVYQRAGRVGDFKRICDPVSGLHIERMRLT